MFTFKFQKDGEAKVGEPLYHVIEGKYYDVVHTGNGSEKDVRIPNDCDVRLAYPLSDKRKNAWHTCYVMNSMGKTVDIITA